MSDTFATLSGQLPTDLANATSDLITAFLKRGMQTDEIVSIVATVAADYGRGDYGPNYCSQLAALIEHRKNDPLPEMVPA